MTHTLASHFFGTGPEKMELVVEENTKQWLAEQRLSNIQQLLVDTGFYTLESILAISPEYESLNLQIFHLSSLNFPSLISQFITFIYYLLTQTIFHYGFAQNKHEPHKHGRRKGQEGSFGPEN